ncbi:MAG: response regulator [Lachnospiraceae bacterium]|nr:response regulator [Lachnospiraceae bacterium]
MNAAKKNTGHSVQNLIYVILLVCGVIISFVLFYRSNVTRIKHQNENHIADIATQRATLVGDLFAENLSYIGSTAIVLETAFQNRGIDAGALNVEIEDQIDPEDVDKIAQILRVYENRFAFDYLRYIDLYGRDYTTGEKVIAAIVTEREYFKEGIQGKTGMTYILDSKVTSERQIGFYSPVYQEGEIVGITVGFYGEDFINNLLEISIFEQDCSVLLCSQDGTIIYRTNGSNEASNFIEELSSFSFSQEEDEVHVREAFAQRSNTLYNYRVNGEQTVGIVSYIGSVSDFFLVLNFPAQVYQAMVRNAGMNGVVLLSCLIALFLAAGIYYVVRFFWQKKKLLEETKNSNDIHFAMSRLFENFVIVNAGTRTYHYIEGMPDVGHIPNDGAYDLFAEDLLDRFPNETERAEAAKLISFGYLTEQMNQGMNIISCNLHAPIREEEWFTYNCIVVSRNGNGDVKEFIIARQDITKLQEKEEEIRRILEQARDEAEKGNRAKSNFLSSMSHDIRTPMNAIIGYTNIALDRIDDQQMVEDSLNKIAGSSQYLLSLINDILDMSKIESGKIQLSESNCDLNTIFDRIEDLTRSQAAKKNLHISFHTDKVIHPLVVVDELRLEQILINITGNAVKYTPDGGDITLTAEEIGELPDGKSRYRFHVRDTGIGMSEDFLPQIFDSFSRETNSTINKIQGTGLCMAITYRLVGLMGGDITVSSKLNEGSEFVVTMDLLRWEKTAKMAEPTAEDTRIDKNELAGRRVLLVEDNDINAEIATLVLSEYGFTVDRATNGAKGVEQIIERGSGYYDAVLMDIQMPVMNGYEATRQIRSLGSEYAANLPIIAMSANAYEEDVQESLVSGMNGHIAKPFDPEVLAAELYKRIQVQT